MISINNFIALIPLIVILIVVAFHALLGYINGTKKTLYYIVVDIILTLLIVFALSFVSIQKYYTTENLLNLLEQIFTIPEAVKEYFESPELNQIIFVLTDIIVRVILFIGIITLTKWIFKFGVFKPIYKRVVTKTYKTKSDRKRGAIIGSLKGLVLGLIFILPIWLEGSSNNYINVYYMIFDQIRVFSFML